MVSRLMNQAEMSGNSKTAVEREESFCPECDQSLDLARHEKATVKRWTLESFVILIFGLCLTVAFGPQAWDTHLRLSRLDQEIAALQVRAAQGTLSSPGNPPTIVAGAADTMSDVLTGQSALQVGFDRDVTGIELGLFTIIVGVASWLHERPHVVDGRRNRTMPPGVPSSVRRQVGGSARELGGLVAITLVRIVLLLLVATVGLQLIRGTPPSQQLVDEALTRVIILIERIASSLS